MKIGKTSAALSLAVILFGAAPSGAEPFSMPDMPERESMEVKIHYEGKKVDLDKATTGQRILYYEAPKAMKINMGWDGQGDAKHLRLDIVERLNSGNMAANIFKFKPSTKFLIMDSIERLIKTPGGKRLRREFYNLANPFLKYPDDLTHVYTLQIAFRGLALDKPGTKRRFHLWLPPNIVVPMEVRVKGMETLAMPDGRSRETYRLDMTPDMAEFIGPILAKIVQPILPKWQFWFETHGTHPFVKYKGPLGKVNVIGVPDEVYELVKLDPDPLQ